MSAASWVPRLLARPLRRSRDPARIYDLLLRAKMAVMVEEAHRNPERCPTPTAHKRLNEAHRFWHECLEEYQSPEGFRVKLNACIQALRNVTFVLQKEKHLIDGFQEWYAPWQERMRSDPILAWVVKSRNRIVKEGDLETLSKARATLITDYYSAADSTSKEFTQASAVDAADHEAKKEVNAPPRFHLEEIVRMAASGLPRRILEESTLVLERRWVDRALPDHEILDALATAYGRLTDLITDAHTRVGLENPVMFHSSDGDVGVQPHPGWHGRLPCMVTTRDARTISVMLKDGTVNDHGRSWRLEYDSKASQEAMSRDAMKRYGKIEPRAGEVWHSSLDAVPFVTDMGRRILQKGDEHGWFMFYFRGGAIADMQVLLALDAAGKRKLAIEAADHVARNGFDSVLTVSEMWMSSIMLDDDGVPIRPAEHRDRSEGLGIFAERSDGQYRSVIIPFERRRMIKKIVVLSEPLDASDQPPHNFFAPLREVWKTWPQQESEVEESRTEED
jgi:hypothetical protein